MALHQIEVPWKLSYDVGVGVDLASGSPMNKVVDGVANGVDNAQGAMVDLFVQRIQSTEDLEQSLGISAEASYGCGCFGGVSARFNFAQSSKIQTSSLFMTITVKVELGALSIDKVKLDAEADATVGNYNLFTTRYGNMFVRGLRRGGLFIGVVQINTRNEDEATQVSAALGGSYGLFSAQLETKLSDVKKTYQAEVRVRMYHEGGPVDLTLDDPTDPMQLLRNANLFLKSFRDNGNAMAVPLSVALAPISIANGTPPPNAAQIEHAQDILLYCAKRRSGILDQLNLLDFINDNKAKYDVSNGATWDAVRAAIQDFQADLDTVAACASQAINHPDQAVMPTDYAAQHGKVFPKASFPTPMPVPIGGKLVEVPDFSGCATADACRTLAKAIGLTLGFEQRQPPGPFRVLDFQPPKGTPLAENGTVTIACPASDHKFDLIKVRDWQFARMTDQLVFKPR